MYELMQQIFVQVYLILVSHTKFCMLDEPFSHIMPVHVDAIKPGDKVIVVDDLLATGGTAEAACKLVKELGGEIVKIIFLVELSELQGKLKLEPYSVGSVVSFEGL